MSAYELYSLSQYLFTTLDCADTPSDSTQQVKSLYLSTSSWYTQQVIKDPIVNPRSKAIPIVMAELPRTYSALLAEFKTKVNKFELACTVLRLIVRKNTPRNPCPTKTKAFGSTTTLKWSWRAINPSWTSADVKPNTIAQTGLLIQAVELKTDTPAPITEKITSLKPQRKQPIKILSTAADDIAKTRENTLTSCVFKLSTIQASLVKRGKKAQQISVPSNVRVMPSRFSQLFG